MASTYDVECPQCGGDELTHSEFNRPFRGVDGFCMDCGYHYFTEDGQMTLEEVNDLRRDRELPPLAALRPTERNTEGPFDSDESA